MNKVQRTVEIELTKEECRILYEAEKLLKEMQREIELIATPTYPNDKQEIADCLDKFMTVELPAVNAASFNQKPSELTEDKLDEFSNEAPKLGALFVLIRGNIKFIILRIPISYFS